MQILAAILAIQQLANRVSPCSALCFEASIGKATVNMLESFWSCMDFPIKEFQLTSLNEGSVHAHLAAMFFGKTSPRERADAEVESQRKPDSLEVLPLAGLLRSLLASFSQLRG